MKNLGYQNTFCLKCYRIFIINNQLPPPLSLIGLLRGLTLQIVHVIGGLPPMNAGNCGDVGFAGGCGAKGC